MADELGMSRSTTHRYAITLVALGYLEQADRRKYRLTLNVCDLGMSALHSTSLREHAHPYLEELVKQDGFTVSVAVLDGPEILYVDHVRGFRRGQSLIDLGLASGSGLPLHCTATGKLLLAYLPNKLQSEMIRDLRLARPTTNKAPTKKALQAELEQIGEGGLAVADQELAQDLYVIAAPLRSFHEVVAAVSMIAHSSMIALDEFVSRLGPHLTSTADRISARLGYRREDELRGRTGDPSSPSRQYAGNRG